MNELELRQLFKNLSDCYADTGRFENDGSYTEGEVIQAMTEDRFIEALKEAKILPIPAVSKSLTPFGESIKLLRDLADLQNGAPLEQHRKEWEETMEQVYDFLNRWEGQ
jgi:hypothetical protein